MMRAMWMAFGLLCGAATHSVALEAKLTVTHGACEARCPVYAATLTDLGAVAYEGRHFVRTAGRAQRRIPADAATALIDRFATEAFLDAPAQIVKGGADCGVARADGPGLTIELIAGKLAKRVEIEGRCGGPRVEALRGLARDFDLTTGAGRLAR